MPQMRSLAVGSEAELGRLCAGLPGEVFFIRCVSLDTEAAGLLQAERWDGLIVDLEALPVTGLDLLRTAGRRYPELVSLAILRLEDQGQADSAREAGAYALLPKPCPALTLRQSLERGWERQRLLREVRVRDRALETINRELDSKIEAATGDLRELNARMLSEVASLREVDRLKSDFLDNVTHDLKNPLTTLRGYLEFLMETDLDAEKRKSCLQHAGSAATHMEYLINQLLEATRLNSRKIKLDLRDMIVPDILAEAGALIQGQTQAGHIRFEIIPDSDPALSLRADRGRLLQVLSNLLGNACKFTPQNGRIVLRAWRENENVHFCVEDSGIGIALEHQVRIFEKFYQVDHSLSKPFKGLGLGLRIAKELVDLHGGKIWVESQPSMGSSFHFVLPRKGPPVQG
jgi:signal transduction histidine kinase